MTFGEVQLVADAMRAIARSIDGLATVVFLSAIMRSIFNK